MIDRVHATTMYLAAEAWRQHYSQTATHQSASTATKLDFELPNGEDVTLHGWTTRQHTTDDPERASAAAESRRSDYAQNADQVHAMTENAEIRYAWSKK